MVDLHDATGQWTRLQALVDYWKRADILAVIEKYEHVLLVNLGILTQTATALIEHNPQHNPISSAHPCWPRRFGGDAAFIRTHLQAAADANYALVIGEFSRYGAYAGGAGISSPNGETDYAAILAECDRLAIGWSARAKTRLRAP